MFEKSLEITDPNVVQIADILHENPEFFPEIVLPGSFDPFHAGHIQAKLEAEKKLNKPVALIVVNNINKPKALFNAQERVAIIRDAFPNDTIYTALSREEVRIALMHTKTIVRKKRDDKDTQQFSEICEQYHVDFSKLMEIDVPRINSSGFKVLSVIDEPHPPSGISELTFQMLKKKYRSKLIE